MQLGKRKKIRGVRHSAERGGTTEFLERAEKAALLGGGELPRGKTLRGVYFRLKVIIRKAEQEEKKCADW